jgi:hypothetical protein
MNKKNHETASIKNLLNQYQKKKKEKKIIERKEIELTFVLFKQNA